MNSIITFARSFSQQHNCKLLVLGGGSAGCTIASKFVSRLGKNNVIIVDPAERHYYQPMFTLIGGGMKTLKDSYRPMSAVLPKDARWLKEEVTEIDPKSNSVRTKQGSEIKYDFLVVALGIQLDFDKIPGLVKALEDPNSEVASNYSPRYVDKTYKNLKNLTSGNAIFTLPNTPIKCAGAPLKACLISEQYLKKTGKRSNVKVLYRTSLPVIFSVKHYADALNELCKQRDIDVKFQQELISINSETKEAVFRNTANQEEVTSLQYSFIHVTPPMGPTEAVKNTKDLVDAAGYVNVDKHTLRSVNFDNVYGIGDCTNLPTSKTAAAVAGQTGVLYTNLMSDMDGNKSQKKSTYNGYTSCPLVTGYNKCILAEFDYTLNPLETFPVDQRQERVSMFVLKKELMPMLYWNGFLKGYWEGPAFLRKLLRFGK